MSNGSVIISLDLEMFWGVQDVFDLETYGENVAGVETVVANILDLFSRHSIHATWATVGFIMAQDLAQLASFLPPDKLRPTYAEDFRNSYRCLEWIENDNSMAKYFLAPQIIKAILDVENQEIATHTFSHYYCDSPGQTLDQFKADIEAAKHIAQELYGTEISTLVFPRNQCLAQYIEALPELGIVAYRGLEEDWIHSRIRSVTLMRLLRLLDSHVALTRAGSYRPHQENHGVVNLRGSRFMRPNNGGYPLFEKLRTRRIKSEMLQAAQTGSTYHLWWHPHNFGVRQEHHMQMLTEIIEYSVMLGKEFGMRSLNMHEASQHCLGRVSSL